MLLGLCSCTSIENEMSSTLGTRVGDIQRFYATTEQSAQQTKVFADEKLRVLWNEGDLLTVFCNSTFNSQYRFDGENGDNAGYFQDVTPAGLHSGNPLCNF